MAIQIDEPSINIGKKTNEQNMASVKSYLSNLTDTLNYMDKRIENLENTIRTFKESED